MYDTAATLPRVKRKCSNRVVFCRH